MICYIHRLNSVVMFGSQTENAEKLIMNSLLHPSLKEAEEPDFNNSRLCSPDQSNMDS